MVSIFVLIIAVKMIIKLRRCAMKVLVVGALGVGEELVKNLVADGRHDTVGNASHGPRFW